MRALPIAAGFRPAAAAAVLALVVDCVYLAAIVSQGEGGSRAGLVSASLAGAAAAAFGSQALARRGRTLALAWAAATLWLWSLLGLASIGLLIVPAAVLATVALTRAVAGRLELTAGVALALVVAAAGLAWTS